VNSSTLSGKWNEVKGLLMQKYGQLSHDELTRAQGDVSPLIGIFQQKSGQSRDDIERFLHSAVGDPAGMASKVSEAASRYASDASDHARRGFGQVEQAAEEGYRATRRYIERSPVKSVALALGVGAVAGVLAAIDMNTPRR
jgi:ElaB/YqjD/DUF883 family membrane-anchored ribosome-binding protein